jgi:hypothetical protein
MNGRTKTSSQIRRGSILILIVALCFALLVGLIVPDHTDIVPKADAANLMVVVPNSLASNEGSINNGLPFNISPGTSTRYQQVYAASEFSALQEPMLIKKIRFRPDAAVGSFSATLADVQINLSTTHSGPNSLSTTFTNNIGPDDTVVFPRGPLALSSLATGPVGGPKAFDIVITLARPFFYDPTLGNLLLEVRNFAGGFTTQFDAHFSSSDPIARMWIFNSLGSPTGFTDTVGMVTAFDFEPANNSPTAFCHDIHIPADADCQASINASDVDAGSFDADPTDTLDFSVDNAGPFALGDNVVTLTVTDDHGASSSCQATVRVVDETPPTIDCPHNVVATLPPNTSATGMVVSYDAPTGNDCCYTPVISTTAASGSIFSLGVTTVKATATDGAGFQAICSFNVTVLYNFSGFFQPVDNPPVVNTATAGSAIPVKFSLSGSKGPNIFAPGSPASQQVACVSGAPVAEVEQILAAGASSISYDPALDQYVYVWKTNKAWKGTCRLLTVTLNDGTTHVANFQFK